MRFACCLFVVLAAVMPYGLRAAAVHVQDNADNNLQQAEPAAAPAGLHGNWALAARVADECARDADATACVAVKASAALERAARTLGPVQLLPGVTLLRNPDSPQQRDSRALPTEDELRGQLKPDTPDRASRVADMVFTSGMRFLQSRTLNLNFSPTDAQELSRAIEEGRGKLKKKIMPILALLAVKIAAVLPFLLGIIGFFALKALVLGKLALIIASVMAFQKYGSSGGFGKFAENFSSASAAGPWSQPAAPAATGGYYRRSMEQSVAQQMAYNGQKPSVQTVA